MLPFHSGIIPANLLCFFLKPGDTLVLDHDHLVLDNRPWVLLANTVQLLIDSFAMVGGLLADFQGLLAHYWLYDWVLRDLLQKISLAPVDCMIACRPKPMCPLMLMGLYISVGLKSMSS